MDHLKKYFEPTDRMDIKLFSCAYGLFNGLSFVLSKAKNPYIFIFQFARIIS